jgi:2-polyprenyl-6-methoxyphenol hydroxylase-like FAD-dependent oxidoreductase
MTPPIAILGAGPAGLLIGRLLNLAGIDFIIFERDTSATSAWGRGGSGTLDLHEGSGLDALQEAGLFEAFKEKARYVHHYLCTRAESRMSTYADFVKAMMCLWWLPTCTV